MFLLSALFSPQLHGTLGLDYEIRFGLSFWLGSDRKPALYATGIFGKPLSLPVSGKAL